MATLKSLVDETTSIKNEIVECRDILKQILIDKKIEDLDFEYKLPNLISKVNLFDNYLYGGTTLFLYKNGDEYSQVTGTWSEVASKNNGSITKNTSSIKLSANLNTVDSAYRVIGINKPIDISKYKKIHISIKSLSVTGGAYFTMRLSEIRSSASSDAFANITIKENLSNVTKTLDVSSFNKTCFVTIGVDTGASSGSKSISLEFNQVWLEK